MSTREKIDSYADACGFELVVADGFDDAILGIAEQCGGRPLVAYDRTACIDILVSRDGLTREEAEEYFEFNVGGAWVGEGTPVFIDTRYAE